MKVRKVKNMTNKRWAFAVMLAGLALLSLGVALAAINSNIDLINKYAWGTNIGWLNFSPIHGGATVFNDHLEGFAWAENVGWIRLGVNRLEPDERVGLL